MKKKIFKPFWSYDIEKTEEWLSSMAAKGYLFVEFHTISRHFIFEKREPQQITYQIVFDKTRKFSLPKTLRNDGWESIHTDRSWHIITNLRPLAEINTFPNREEILKRNQMIMYIFGGILVYLSFSLLMAITLISSSFLGKAPVEVVPSPFWVFTPFIGLTMIGIWALTLYSTIKLYKCNRDLTGELPIQEGLSYINEDKEKALKNSGKMIVIRKWFWFDAPDKLEKWLEKKELQGYHLQRIGKMGITFFFKKGRERKVRYSVDYQMSTKKKYFDMHTESGWKPMFVTGSFQSKWTIWSREYNEIEGRPELYTEQSDQLKHSRKIVINNILLVLPMFLLIYLMLTMDNYFSLEMSLYRWSIFVIYILGIVFATTRVVRSISYYFRMVNMNYKGGS